MDPQHNQKQPNAEPGIDNSFTPEVSPTPTDTAPDQVVNPEGSAPSSVEPTSAPAEPVAETAPAAAEPVIISPTNSLAAAAPVASSEPAPAVSPVTPPVTDASTPPPMYSAPSDGRSKRLLWAVLAVVVVLLLAVGYTFAIYLPNQPSNVYKTSLTNSGKALDKLIAYTKSQEGVSYKSTALDSTMKFTSSGASFDASLNGAFDKDSNGTLQLKADIEGQNFTANVRSIKASGNKYPDVYFQVGGIKSYLDSAGLGSLDNLDGQWVSVDHTLIGTYASTLQQSVDSTTKSNVANAATVPTTAQINDAIDKVQAVNKQYLFTADSSKAVLTNEKFIAKETKNGRSVDHYKVGYSKDHLNAYVKAVGSALDSSSLNNWSKKANDGQSLSDALNLKDAEDSVQKAKSDYTMDLWADTSTKLVSSMQFGDPSDPSTKVTISQGYTGGSKYPFGLSYSGKDTSGALGQGSLNITVDSKTNKYNGSFEFSSDDAGNKTDLSGTFTLTPGKDSVKVAKPAGAKPINDILNQLGLGGLSTSSQASGSDDFSLTQ